MTTLANDPPRITADPAEWALDPETERSVARLYLTRITPAELRDRVASGVCGLGFVGMFRAIADAMDALLAEGFDPPALAAALRAGAPSPAAA
jgi:hypothetical protein